MRINWSKPPNFVVVGGSEWFFVDRFRNQISESAKEAGLEVLVADTAKGVEDSLFSWESVFQRSHTRPKFITFRGWRSDFPLPSDFEVPEGSCILYVVDGPINKKVCPVLARVEEDFVIKFNKFTGSWNKKVKNAAEFVSAEFSSRDLEISDSVSESLVRTAGFDFGTLNFEIEKASILALERGSGTVDLGILKDTIKPTNHFDFSPLRESLSKIQPVQFMRFMKRAYSRSVSDPTMVLLRGKGGVGDLAVSWLQVHLLSESGVSPDVISKVVGVPVWAVARDMLPASRRWGYERLKKLVSGVAESDVGIVTGCPNPRVKLESAVLSAMMAR